MNAVLTYVSNLSAQMEQHAARTNMAATARLFWDHLRTLKDLVQLDLTSQTIITHWLREFNFSDGPFMEGGKLSNFDEEWELDDEELEFFECPVCKTVCHVETGEILKLGETDVPDENFELAEEEGYAFEEGEDICPLCGNRMELVLVDTSELPLHIPAEWRQLLEEGGPYPTLAENAEFRESLRGGYPIIGEQREREDDHDVRQPEGWAEYLEPKGLWHFLGETTTLEPEAMVSFLQNEEGPSVKLWTMALQAHQDAEINAVALSVLADALGIEPEFFSVYGLGGASSSVLTPAEKLAARIAGQVDNSSQGNADKAAWLRLPDTEAAEFRPTVNALLAQHVTGRQTPVMTLAQFQDTFPELDDIELDLPREDWTPATPGEEQSVADNTARGWEWEMFNLWQAQVGQPWVYEGGQPVWSAFWKDADVPYNTAKFYAILGGASREQADEAANRARLRFLSRGKVVRASGVGLEFSTGKKLTWVDAAQVAKYLKPANRNGLLAQMRKLWVAANGNKPHIAVVGKELAA